MGHKNRKLYLMSKYFSLVLLLGLFLLSSCFSPDLEIKNIEFKTLDRSSSIYVEKGSVQGPIAVVISANNFEKENGVINPYIEVTVTQGGLTSGAQNGASTTTYPYLRGTKTVGDSIDSIVILLNDGLPLENGVYLVTVAMVDENNGKTATRTETLSIP